MLMMINADVSRRRRQFYKRALTLSSIPPQLIPEVENETDEDEQTNLLKSPKHAAEKNTIVLDDGSGTRTSIVKDDSNLIEGNANNKRALFQQRRSITISSDEPLLPLKEYNSGKKSPFSKSPTSPSAILTKFKERIQQSLFISSTEWPSAAAILNDRRQKANEHAKATFHQKDLDIESIQMTELTKKRKRCRRSDTVGHAPDGEGIEDTERLRRCRMKSDPVVYSTQKENNPINDDTMPADMDLQNRDAARDAFRRRSISEDTYDRLPPSYIKERKQIQASQIAVPCIDSELTSSRSSNNSGGIVCSNEDLQEILTCYKRDKSPTPVMAPSRTISVDVSKHPRQSYTSQSSYTPSYVSQTSVTSTGSEFIEASCDNLSRVHSRMNSTSSSIHVYPEVILDSCKGQATIGPLDLNNPDGNEYEQPEVVDDEADDNDEEVIQQPPEIVYDEYGQTWDVYGAEIDPEILGSAIQKHLEKLMNCHNGENKPCTASNNQSTQHEHESRSKAFLSWWRFLCLFGTTKHHQESTYVN